MKEERGIKKRKEGGAKGRVLNRENANWRFNLGSKNGKEKKKIKRLDEKKDGDQNAKRES